MQTTLFVLVLAVEMTTGKFQTPPKTPLFATMESCQSTEREVLAYYRTRKDIKRALTHCGVAWFPDYPEAKAGDEYVFENQNKRNPAPAPLVRPPINWEKQLQAPGKNF